MSYDDQRDPNWQGQEGLDPLGGKQSDQSDQGGI
jgi:hypothetical protein